jgi:hypothetical protein
MRLRCRSRSVSPSFSDDRGSIAAERDQDQAEVAILNSKCSVANDVACGENRFKLDQAVMRMNVFKIKIARIEMISPNERGADIRLTFQFESSQTSFALPIFLKSCEFDDTEIVRVARSKLHDVFWQLCSQCEDWQLTDDERRELARISVRPGVKPRE